MSFPDLGWGGILQPAFHIIIPHYHPTLSSEQQCQQSAQELDVERAIIDQEGAHLDSDKLAWSRATKIGVLCSLFTGTTLASLAVSSITR